ncbi:ventrally expressed dharma/bozozok antagonist [Kryptolebias marmoratus]|uniref:Ventrally expressed dharma/bozozok antagonist n=1 Tax=Kryptolebias marmoratus TaxID=37003 RepID=A0A3Q3BAZ8_KRYMA|nr:ventrally expressed dharma/bozozok antagonist [Kryptolebias marmoratus]
MMRGRFSIEWMAQSSQLAGPETSTSTASGPAAWGTNSEALPGFYCRQKTESLPGPEQEDAKHRGLDAFSQHNLPQTSPSIQATESGFSSGTEEETSGYESEGGQVLSPSDCTSTSPPSPPAGRRPRTAFTAEQINSLERAFKKNAYLGTQDKMELCKKLSLSDKQIRNWFQNRRMKLKRTVQDALAHACQANMASQFLHYPELQAYRPAPYPRYHSAAAEAPASYVHPHGLQYASPLPGTSALSLDSFYQYGSVPGAMPTPHVRGPYPTYPQYYC